MVLVGHDHYGRFGVAEVVDHVVSRCGVVSNVDLDERDTLLRKDAFSITKTRNATDPFPDFYRTKPLSEDA